MSKTVGAPRRHGSSGGRPLNDDRHTKPCFAIINSGFCKFGDQCYFSHDESILRRDPSYGKHRNSSDRNARPSTDRGPRPRVPADRNRSPLDRDPFSRRPVGGRGQSESNLARDMALRRPMGRTRDGPHGREQNRERPRPRSVC